jgi:hypothetical protein
VSRTLRAFVSASALCAALGGVPALAQTPAPMPVPAKQAQAQAKTNKAKPKPTQSVAAKPIPAQPVPAAPEVAPLVAPTASVGSADGLHDGADQLELDTLGSRYRPAIHPGDPLVIVGNEQGDNDLRSITPNLARGEHAPQLVDTDENYKRALAMYGDGQMFHTPPRPALGAEPLALEPRHRAPVKAPIASAPKVEKPEAAPWSVLSGLIVAALLITWFLMRVRPALTAPKQAAAAQPEPQPFVWNPVRRTNTRASGGRAEPASVLPSSPPTAQKPRQR